MGASIGAAALTYAQQVLWAGDHRSADTHLRAEKAGLTDCGSVQNLCARSDVLISVCPPHDAELVVEEVLSHDFSGIFVDGNAIAPSKSRYFASLFASGQYVDGGIVGGPAWHRDHGTVLYLSGLQAAQVAAIFDRSPLHTHIISDDAGAASAMKMVFAAYSKGSTALLTAIMGVAETEGVRETLEAQWGEAFTQRTHQQVLGASAKAWRFVGEMHEISTAFEQAGASGEFHHAAADVFAQLAEFKNNPASDIETLLRALHRKP